MDSTSAKYQCEECFNVYSNKQALRKAAACPNNCCHKYVCRDECTFDCIVCKSVSSEVKRMAVIKFSSAADFNAQPNIVIKNIINTTKSYVAFACKECVPYGTIPVSTLVQTTQFQSFDVATAFVWKGITRAAHMRKYENADVLTGDEADEVMNNEEDEAKNDEQPEDGFEIEIERNLNVDERDSSDDSTDESSEETVNTKEIMSDVTTR